ncbi:MAG: hypothetical protein M9908_02200 [Phyllobacteriaceae bacterium]|nr:hypothetical protein [Nitratireductor sp.]MCO5133161.1 hypothetical protein [Phyllobacteriaceae bacterium]
MIRPASQIEYPPSEALRAKASMLARMEALKASGDALMAVIAERVVAERAENQTEVDRLTGEQDRLIANMKRLAAA